MGKHGNCGRPWTPYEDDLLRTAVRIYGDNTEKWKTIARSVPGRTNKACRKRWLHSLSPSVKKSAWTAEEDQLLLSLFEKLPNKWSQIAREIPGRTDDACSKRYREALDPNLKKDEWTDEEDTRLLDALARQGGPTNPKWGLIGQELRRSGLGCRNRWRLIQRKRNAAARQNTTTQASPVNENALPEFSTDDWSLFTDGDPSYWAAAAIDPVDVSFRELQYPHSEREIALAGISEEQLEDSAVHSSSTQSGSIGSRASIVQTTGPNATAEGTGFSNVASVRAIAYSSSSDELGPDSQLPEPTNRVVDNQISNMSCSNDVEVTHYPLSMHVPDDIDCNAQQNDDAFRFYDEITQNSPPNGDNIERRRTSEETPCAQEDSRDSPLTESAIINETDNLSSLGTLAHAASTLSPSPCAVPAPRLAQHTIHDLVVPPRKRRRTATNCPGIGSMHVISGLVGKEKAAPKLSSSLPVADDPSILAYACGHSTCLSSSSAASSLSFPTAAELLSHFKDEHMSDAGAGDEAPFRCGLRGCNKRWKSINGLQYHLQVSKVHYQDVYSRTTASRQQSADHIPGSDATGTDSPDGNSSITTKRVHKCPHPGCVKEYKQLSGLRYHLLHGHPKDMPAQLSAVPPRIAKELGIASMANSS